MKKLLVLCAVLFINTLSAQHIYKDRKFFGGFLYFNSDALKDIIIDGDEVDIFGTEYWNNSPFDTTQTKDVEIRAKFRANITYGYFPMDNLAIGGRFKVSSNSFNEEVDTLYLLQNKSFDLTVGPFVRYYIELGAQPYEIGAVFIEGAYHYGVGSSEDNLRLTINDTISWRQTESYDYSLSIIKTKVGFSWYLSDFISHNWFTGALLSLEPSISYNWTIKNEFNDDIVRKYRGIRFDLALIAYF
ncbi:MAG TPA: hypothetical protein EYG01_04220 [Flavobacteriales bacterium]|nr:hypothetical protein [Flavobacteriales bacterium]